VEVSEAAIKVKPTAKPETTYGVWDAQVRA
jgi:hypothetical protein